MAETPNNAPGVPNPSCACREQGCRARADVNDMTPNPACLQSCRSADFASFSHGKKGDGFKGMKGDLEAHKPTREEKL